MRLATSPLSRLARWLPSPGARTFTALSADPQWLKLLHATGGPRGRTVTALIALPIQDLTADDLLAKLREACGACRVDPEGVLVVNPAHLTTTRVFSIPSVDWREIRDIVDLQAEKHTPYSKDEILTDFTIVETDPSGYSKVMLAIAHQDVVHRAVRIVEGMGWPLERVGVEVEGVADWLRVAKGGAMKQPLLVADLDVEATTVVVVRHGKPLFHRSLSFGIKQLMAEPSGLPSRLVAELRRTVEAFDAEGWHLALSGAVLTGQVERLPDLPAQVQQGLELPTQAIPATERFALTPSAEEGQAAAGPVSFAGLLGSMARAGELDLTPKPLRLNRAFELRTRSLITMGCQLIATLVLVAGLVVLRAQQDERRRAVLRQESRRVAQEAAALDFALKQVEVVRGWLTVRGQFLDLLTELNRQSSDAIRWDLVEFTQGERLLLKGTSRETPRVFDLVAALKRSNRFRSVEAKRVAPKRDANGEVTSFELTCELATETSAAKPAS